MKLHLMLAMATALVLAFGPGHARADIALAGSGDPFPRFFSTRMAMESMTRVTEAGLKH